MKNEIKRAGRLPGKQKGFIQNLILPGLVLLGAVIGSIALLTNSSQGGTDKEQAAANAAGILSQGILLKDSVQRAMTDGIPASTIASSLSAALVGKGYIVGVLPSAPAGSQVNSTPWVFSNGTYQVKDSQDAAAELGTTAKDDVLTLANLNKDTCIRINNKLYGESIDKAADANIGVATTATGITGPVIATSSNAAALKVGNGEGCVPDGAGAYTYYKVVGAK